MFDSDSCLNSIHAQLGFEVAVQTESCEDLILSNVISELTW